MFYGFETAFDNPLRSPRADFTSFKRRPERKIAMRQQIALDQVAIHASFNQISANRSYAQNPSRRPVENIQRPADKAVAKVLLAIGACMLVSISAGTAFLLYHVGF
jgi:hypothetical protein